MIAAAKPALRIVRDVTDHDIEQAELDLNMSMKYFDAKAATGPWLLTPEQLRNYARIMQRARELLTAIRADR